jgi:hypothetical protein
MPAAAKRGAACFHRLAVADTATIIVAAVSAAAKRCRPRPNAAQHVFIV